jgi:hypothetical protein
MADLNQRTARYQQQAVSWNQLIRGSIDPIALCLVFFLCLVSCALYLDILWICLSTASHSQPAQVHHDGFITNPFAVTFYSNSL